MTVKPDVMDGVPEEPKLLMYRSGEVKDCKCRAIIKRISPTEVE
jgi:hypothetical protein